MQTWAALVITQNHGDNHRTSLPVTSFGVTTSSSNIGKLQQIQRRTNWKVRTLEIMSHDGDAPCGWEETLRRYDSCLPISVGLSPRRSTQICLHSSTQQNQRPWGQVTGKQILIRNRKSILELPKMGQKCPSKDEWLLVEEICPLFPIIYSISIPDPPPF